MTQKEITETTETEQPHEAAATSAPPKSTPASGGARGAKKAASIGSSIVIHGDVAGEEDLVVDGTIEGTVNFKDNNLVVSKNGRVTANINARIIRVDGEVKGELRGSEQVVISPSGKLKGDIRAPRVVLELANAVGKEGAANFRARGRTGCRSECDDGEQRRGEWAAGHFGIWPAGFTIRI